MVEPSFFIKFGVDFINLFIQSFYACRSQKRKSANDLTAIFVLLGSAGIKAARKMLMKLTLGIIQS
jgi:hypothetical protein